MDKIKTILLALDIGEVQDVLVKKTCFLAKKFGANVIPMRIVEIAPLYSGSPVIDIKEIYNEIYSQLYEVKQSMIKIGVSVREAIVNDGDPRKLIPATARKLNADLIILGANKKSVFERLIGSTAEYVIRNSRQPVYCVHPQDSVSAIEKVVCALDGSSASSHTLKEAINFCRLVKAKLQIIHIIPFVSYYPGFEEFGSPFSEWGQGGVSNMIRRQEKRDRQIDQEEEARFSEFLGKFDFSGLDFNHKICRGYAAEEIIRIAKEKGCDLLVLGAVDQKEATTFFKRGTVQKVLRNVPCSVLTIKHLKGQDEHRDLPQQEAIS